MKISYKLGGFLIISSVLIFFLNFYRNTERKRFLFNRKITDNLKINDGGINLKQLGNKRNINSAINFVVEDSAIKINDSLIIHNLYYHNIMDTNYLSKIKVTLPSSSIIEFANLKNLLIIDKLNLSVYDIEKKINTTLKKINLKVIKAIGLKDNLSKVLCLAERKNYNNYVTSFVVVNLDSNKIENQSKLLESNTESKAIQNILIYDGNFATNNKQGISYYCNKYSQLFFFNDDGILKYEITTMDKTPLPSLVENKSGFYFKRGYTFITNNGVVVYDDKALIFSSRTESNNSLMIDVYSISTNKYLYSKELSIIKENCSNINFIKNYDNKVYIKFRNNKSLSFSFIFNDIH